MQKNPLIIKKLSIRKMPGLPQGLPAYNDLTSNINIIAGPNASGKSSTARLIQQIIWHNKTQGIQADSLLNINKERWDVKIDSKNITILREGIKDELTGLPAAEDSNRYMLALHELFVEDEGGLAKKIVKESIGGVDLDKARENLEHSNKINNTNVGEFKKYEKAEKDYNETEQKQRDLKNDEQQLDKLKEEKQNAEKAQNLKEFYQLTAEYIKARLEFEVKKQEFETFPSVFEKVTGEEYDKIEELEKNIESCKNNIRIAEQEIERNNITISKLKIPETGVDDEVITELEERIKKASDLERDMHETVNKISQSEAKELVALKSIDETTDPSGFKGLKLDDVSGLDKFLDDAHKALSEKKYLKTEYEKLKDQVLEKPADSDNINKAITTLSYWLQEQKTQKDISKKWLIALPAAVIITAFATYFSLIAGLAAVVLFAILAIYIYTTKPKKESDLRKTDFEKTGLIPPAEWTIGEVAKRLDELNEELISAKSQENINRRIEIIDNALKELQPRLDNIKIQYESWLEKLKLMPELPTDNLKNYSGMYWFLKNISDWQQNHNEAEALKASRDDYYELWKKNIQRINTIFSDYRLDSMEDATQALAVFKKLKDDESNRRGAVKEITNQEQKIKDNQIQKDENTQKLENIYKKLDISFGQKDEVKNLLEQLENYKKSRQEYNDAGVRLAEREKEVRAHSLYVYHTMEVETLTPDEAEKLITDNSEIASRLDEVKENITAIETRVKAAKEGADLENALKEKDEALNNLQQLYENNLSSITGNIIVDKLKSFTRDKNRPKVFDHAKNLLNRITNGRYDLILDDSDDADFSAFDNVLNKEQPLNELSTGTRIQLLLAVRLAFIETIESSIKLPVLADELLANSDDLRAKAIIEALIEISKNGRQIFYFTAQEDEVLKWKTYLDKIPDVHYKIYTLTGQKDDHPGYDYDKTGYSVDFVKFVLEVPETEGKSYQDYGKLIGADAFDPLLHEPEQIHLWYLFEDSKTLYNCLKKNIVYWGQLKSFIDNGGQVEGLDDNQFNLINEKVKLLERFVELYRIGRPKPIDRQVLEQSGAVSESFIDKVADKLYKLNGNPVKLLQTLKNSEVPGFRQTKIDELEQYLEYQGYIDDDKPLSTDEIITQLQALLSTMDIDASKAEKFINNVLTGRF